ncbi:ABC transporter permease [Polaromonas sp. SM01]|uniref:MlaE family ABC transporter permease n=1 Tax=Polaromonas sp. SM01 TaxID=3085630 RepID=UPI0029816FA3|nr:ABC transporter permease [Polaromonas sp. SM01]MDW5441799.1 ABC transporter permease [Polaromonas sp. SM01]
MTLLDRRLNLLTELNRQAQSWLLGWWRLVYLGAQILVLILSPSSYSRQSRRVMARHIYHNTAPNLMGFTLMCALITLVITRIVIATALSYGLSHYALQVVIRVLVLELIPLTAALFVALRCAIASGVELSLMRRSGELEALQQRGLDPVRREVLPRVTAGVCSTVTLAALSCVVALVMAYLAVYGFELSGLPIYTRLFGQVFSPEVSLIFVMKTLFFSLAVSLIPMASALYDPHESSVRTSAELRMLVRMFAVILLIEVVSLVGNYY